MTDLLTFFNDRTEDIISTLSKLVEYESYTGYKTGVNALSAHLHEILSGLDSQITVYPRQLVGDIRLAKWNTKAAGDPILILTHIDTVWPPGTLEIMPLKRDEFKLYGPGVLDMKAGIAIAFHAIQGLIERGEMPQRPIYWLLTSDEETGSEHSQDLILEIARLCKLVLVLEPAAESESLKTSRKGIACYKVQAHGIAAHAGADPEKGLNALVELAHQIIAIHKLNNLRVGTSVNVANALSGRSGANVVPDYAEINVDARFSTRQAGERLDQDLHSLKPVLPGSRIVTTGGIKRYPMERDASMIENFKQVQSLAEKLGMSLNESTEIVGGVSDGNLTAAAGIPTLDGLGGYGDGMHALHEHVLIRSLPRRAALLASILRDWQFS